MEYVITVTQATQQHPHGEFVFSTSAVSRPEAFRIYHLLKSLLPEGYELSVTKWEKIGTDVTDQFEA